VPRSRPKRRTQAERSALSEKRILRAAAKLIARQGYTKTTLAQIGKEAGYAPALVSHRFGSKPGLLRELVLRIRTRFNEDQIARAVAGKAGREALEAVADTYLNELRVREERMRVLYVLMGEALGPVAEIRPLFARADREFRALAARWIEGGIRAGEIRSDVVPAVEAAVFVGMLRGVAKQWLTEPGSFDLEGAAESVKRTLHARLAPAAETEGRDRSPRRARLRSVSGG
jgi:AcrR family transcriptional regulator